MRWPQQRIAILSTSVAQVKPVSQPKPSVKENKCYLTDNITPKREIIPRPIIQYKGVTVWLRFICL